MSKSAPAKSGRDPPAVPAELEKVSAHAAVGEQREKLSPAASAPWLGACWTALKFLLTNLFRLFTVLITALLVIAVIQETSRDVVMIRPIEVPKILIDQGFTSSIVTQHLLDQIAFIIGQNESKALGRPYLKEPKSYSTELGEIDVQLPGLGSFRSALSLLRNIFGAAQAEISGEIILQDDKHLVLRLKASTRRGEFSDITSSGVATGSEKDTLLLDDILSNGAIQTVRNVDPYALAIYYLDKDPTKLPEVLQYCEDIDPSCKPWAALLRGLVSRDHGDLYEAVTSFQDVIGETRYPADAWPTYRAALANMALANMVMVRQAETAHDFRPPKVQQYPDTTNMFGRVIRLFEHHGQTMDAYDEFFVGHIYELGYSTGPHYRPDCGQAVSWYRRAAAGGSATAENSLGDLYNPQNHSHFCDGVLEPADVDARYWYERAAAGGQVYAQRGLGEIYRDGTGFNGKANPHVAIYYLKEAAEKDDFRALTDLGLIYQYGLGVYPDGIEPDLIKACAWLELAVEAPGSSAGGRVSCSTRFASPHRAHLDYSEAMNVVMADLEYSKAMNLVRDWNLGHRSGL
jgi:TPR repeat protein